MEEKIIIKSEFVSTKTIQIIIWMIGVVFALIELINDGGIYSLRVPIIRLVVIGVIAVFGIIATIVNAWLSKNEITVTNKRIYGKRAFGRRVDLPIDSISAVGVSALKGLAVGTSSGKIKFHMIQNRDEIHKAISDLLIVRQTEDRAAQKPTAAVQQSDADELAKFKKLLDDGIITQEEFDAKKRQILGL